MTQYNVTGMSCAACVARVEKAVSKIDGVNSCSVSLLTNSMKNRPMQRILSKIPKHPKSEKDLSLLSLSLQY